MEKDNIRAKDRLQAFYDDQENKALIEKYLSESFFDVIGKNRSESAHTNFLKWFFSQKEWSNQALKLFLKLICSKAESQDFVSLRKLMPPCNEWDKWDMSLKKNIRTEHPCFCMVNGIKQILSVDLVFDCTIEYCGNKRDLKIVLENKIDSPELHDQTWKYYVYFSNDDSACSQKEEDKASITAYKKGKNKYPNSKEEIQAFVLLSPYSEIVSRSPRGICDKYIRVLYQEFYDVVLKPIMDGLPANIDSRKVGFLIEYKKNLISPVLFNKDKYRKNMAFEKEDIELLKEFWHKNLPLFSMAAEAVVKYSTDAEEIEAVSDIRRGISALNKKSTLYNLILPDGNVYEGLLMKEVGQNVVSYLLDKKVDKSTIKATLPNDGWLQTKEEYLEGMKNTSDLRYESRKDIVDGNLYLSNQWTAPKFNTFKEKLQIAFPEIKITVCE